MDLSRRDHSSYGVSLSLNNAGVELLRQGRYRQAERALREAVAALRLSSFSCSELYQAGEAWEAALGSSLSLKLSEVLASLEAPGAWSECAPELVRVVEENELTAFKLESKPGNDRSLACIRFQLPTSELECHARDVGYDSAVMLSNVATVCILSSRMSPASMPRKCERAVRLFRLSQSVLGGRCVMNGQSSQVREKAIPTCLIVLQGLKAAFEDLNDTEQARPIALRLVRLNHAMKDLHHVGAFGSPNKASAPVA